ncbi:radical SAM protein [Zavarzinella formosa]|uniref:radical SAM protein n=1 Tax=Zavarzinella formosa TaxID=360055 RepID=UPI00030C9E37|nr:radical SAM protein [Zavarzinella formosa]
MTRAAMNRLAATWVRRPSGCSDVYYHRPTGRIVKGSLPAEATSVYSSLAFWDKAPLRAYFDYTNLCNLECSHCITNSSPHADTAIELSTSRVLELIQEFEAMGVLEVQISGGEPLVHPDWRNILSCVTMSGMNLILTTNGTRLTDKVVADLTAVRPLEVRVSFDGGPNLHDQIRGKGVYAKAMAGAARLAASGIQTTARFTLVKDGEREIPKLCEDLKKIGINRLKVAVVKEAGRAAIGDGRHHLRELPTLVVASRLKALGESCGMDVQLSLDDFPVTVEESHDPKLRDSERANCGAGFDTCYISPQGDVLGCVTIPGMGFGNLKKLSFRDVWESRVAADYRHKAESSGARRICDALNKPAADREEGRIGLMLV